MKKIILGALLLGGAACSPSKSSPNDEKHQLEMTLHEVKTNLDDLRHDINCFQTELQILDGRIKYNENALANLKTQDIEKQQTRIDQLHAQVHAFEKKWTSLEKNREHASSELGQLASHAEETTAALIQCKERIEELEKELVQNQRKFEELGKLKGNIDTIAKSLRSGDGYKIYKVRPGDSLEKIAKAHRTAVEKIKKLNNLDQDLIVVGQELKIPSE